MPLTTAATQPPARPPSAIRLFSPGTSPLFPDADPPRREPHWHARSLRLWRPRRTVPDAPGQALLPFTVAPAADGFCRHCAASDGSYRNGLCRLCYDRPGVSARYPKLDPDSLLDLFDGAEAVDEYAYRLGHAGDDDFPDPVPCGGLRPPLLPTPAPPGSAEKVTAMRHRLLAGEYHLHPDDAVMDPEGGRGGRSVPGRDAADAPEPELADWFVAPRTLARIGADAYATAAERLGVRVRPRPPACPAAAAAGTVPNI